MSYLGAFAGKDDEPVFVGDYTRLGKNRSGGPGIFGDYTRLGDDATTTPATTTPATTATSVVDTATSSPGLVVGALAVLGGITALGWFFGKKKKR